MDSNAVSDELAVIARALGNPLRLRILDVLTHGERSVDDLARRLGCPMTTASSQLKVLRDARLIVPRREGTRIYHRVADERVLALLMSLRAVAEVRNSEVRRLVRDFAERNRDLDEIGAPALLTLLESGEATLIDVRPRDEFEAGHIPGAVSMPLDEIGASAEDLPKDAPVIAYCRDAYCVLAPQAVRLFADLGIHSERLEIGYAEWVADRQPVTQKG